jgi:hypothetical protein
LYNFFLIVDEICKLDGIIDPLLSDIELFFHAYIGL